MGSGIGNHGFTLVELMIAVAMGSIVIMGGYSLLQSQRDHHWRATNKATVNEEREEFALLARRRLPAIIKSMSNVDGMFNSSNSACSAADTACSKKFEMSPSGDYIEISITCESTAGDPLLSSLDFAAKSLPNLSTSCFTCGSGNRPRVVVTMQSNGHTTTRKYPRLDIGSSSGEGKYSGGVGANICIAPPTTSNSWQMELIQLYFDAPPDSSWHHDGNAHLAVNRVVLTVAPPDQLGDSIQLVAPN